MIEVSKQTTDLLDLKETPVDCSIVECYNRSQEIILLQVYDRSMSQNSCARTDIALKRGSRARLKEQQTSSNHSNNNNNEQRHQQQQQQQQQQLQQPEIPSLPSLPSGPSSAAAAAAMMMMGLKQEDRNLSVCVSKKQKKVSLLNFVLEIIIFLG